MKKLFTLVAAFCLAFGATAWAETYSFTFAKGDLTTSSTSYTSGDVEWALSSSPLQWNGTENQTGYLFGSKKNPVTLEISTEDITMNVACVKVVGRSNNANQTAAVAVKVGGSDFACSTSATWTNENNQTLVFTGNATGKIAVTITPDACGYVLAGITVSSEGSSEGEGGEDEDACTPNPLAFNNVSDGVLPEDDYYSINLTSLITNNGTGGEIAFDIEGENKADAFIDEDDITFKTLYAGTYTIYALQAADETYCDGEVHFTITVKAAGEGEGEGGGEEEGNTVTYAKITSAEQLEAGNYLIVYEKGNVIFDGSLTTLDASNNNQSVTISENKIKADSKYQFTLAAIDGEENGYSIMSASGYYIGQTSDANGLKSSTTTVYTNTISFDASGNADIVSGSAYLRYNKTSGQDRFRYFKSASYSSQQAIALYKEVKGSSVGLGQLSSEVIYTEPGRVVCSGAFRIYDLLGRDVTRQNGSLSGIYVVKTATAVQKVVVE